MEMAELRTRVKELEETGAGKGAEAARAQVRHRRRARAVICARVAATLSSPARHGGCAAAARTLFS
eukprot:5328183-Pyramimonas_sp.AAC.1